jgi:hypothetical protein
MSAIICKLCQCYKVFSHLLFLSHIFPYVYAEAHNRHR